MEDRQQPRHLLLHVKGGAHDVGLEQRIDLGVLAGDLVSMMDVRGEDLVLAMLAPRLRKALQFHVRGCMRRQTERGARGLHLWVPVVVPDGLHFLEVQGEQALF